MGFVSDRIKDIRGRHNCCPFLLYEIRVGETQRYKRIKG